MEMPPTATPAAAAVYTSAHPPGEEPLTHHVHGPPMAAVGAPLTGRARIGGRGGCKGQRTRDRSGFWARTHSWCTRRGSCPGRCLPGWATGWRRSSGTGSLGNGGSRVRVRREGKNGGESLSETRETRTDDHAGVCFCEVESNADLERLDHVDCTIARDASAHHKTAIYTAKRRTGRGHGGVGRPRRNGGGHLGREGGAEAGVARVAVGEGVQQRHHQVRLPLHHFVGRDVVGRCAMYTLDVVSKK